MVGVAAKLASLQLVLAIDFDVGHDHGQHPFMNIDSRYPVGHKLLLAGAESVPQVTSTRVAGCRRSHRRRDNAQLFAQSRTLRIRQANSLDFSTAGSTSPLRTLSYSA